jgi:hypothetical protein
MEQTQEGVKQTREGVKQTREGVKQTQEGLKQTLKGVKQTQEDVLLPIHLRQHRYRHELFLARAATRLSKTADSVTLRTLRFPILWVLKAVVHLDVQ